jgi:hypothetical protein
MRLLRKSVACVRLTARRKEVKRILRSSTLLKKHIVRGAVLSLVPSEVTDIVVHHARVEIGEIARVAADSITTTAVGTVMSISMTALKYL